MKKADKEKQKVVPKETKREIALKNMKKANDAKRGTTLFYRQGWHKTFMNTIMQEYGGIEQAVKAMSDDKKLDMICKAAHEYVKKDAGTGGVSGDDIKQLVSGACEAIEARVRARRAALDE